MTLKERIKNSALKQGKSQTVTFFTNIKRTKPKPAPELPFEIDIPKPFPKPPPVKPEHQPVYKLAGNVQRLQHHLKKSYKVFRKTLPLSLDIKDQISADRAIKRGLVLKFIKHWVSQPKYIKRLSLEQCRYNLDGSQAEKISDNHRNHALSQLAKGKS